MLVYSIASRQSFEQVKILRDKILNHLVSSTCPIPQVAADVRSRLMAGCQLGSLGYRGQ